MPRSATRKSKPRGGRKGKVTICHATGSSTNPYVQITVSENAVKAHRAHQHGEDLIGVPAGGCPGGAKTEGQAKGEQGKVTICHATGSASNPFVSITVAASALAAHTRHQHGEDIVGAAEPCVAETPAGVTAGQPDAGSTPTAAGPSSGSQVAGTVAESAPGTTNAEGGGVRGVSADSGTRPKAAVAAGGRESASGGSLPFTGFALIVLALVGAACLVGGTRLRSAQRRDA